MNASTPAQRKYIYALLRQLDWKQKLIKEELIMSYTNDSTRVSTTNLTEDQATHLIAFLEVKKREQKQNEPDECDKIRKGIIAITYQLNWYIRIRGELVIDENGKKQLDYGRIDQWCMTKTAAKKPLNSLSKAELQKAFAQIRTYYRNSLKTPKNKK